MSGLQKINRLIQREQYMLNQFCNNLQATINRLAEKNGAPLDTLALLSEQLKDEDAQSWHAASQVELALIDLYDDVSLITEWQRRLAEVDRLPKYLSGFYLSHQTETNAEILKALLVRLVTDIQWIRESKRVIRVNESQMRKKIVALFLCAFVVFFSPTIMRLFFGYEFDNLRLYYIFTAATSGILGAAFSQLTSIQSRVKAATLDQVRAMSQLGYITARAMVGAGAGLIMFYLMQSGLLSGAFFPEFIHTLSDLEGFRNELATTAAQQIANTQGVSQAIESSLAVGTLARPAQGLSLLIVWCLIAGFSEKMIPGILEKKSKKAQEDEG